MSQTEHLLHDSLSISDMSVHHIPDLEIPRMSFPILPVLHNMQSQSHGYALLILLFQDIGAGVQLGPVENRLSHSQHVVVRDPLGIGKLDSNLFRYRNLPISYALQCQLTSSIRRLGSGPMTVRPEKSTRFPDKFPRNRPCLPLRR